MDLTSFKMAFKKKERNQVLVKRGPLYIGDGNIYYCNSYENQCGVIQKLTNRFVIQPRNSAIE